MLERLYSTFPGRWPGVGLLLLRAAVGGILAVEGLYHFAAWRDLGVLTRGICLLEIVGGASLTAGYLTPFAALLLGLLCVGDSLSWYRVPDPDFFSAGRTATLATLIAAALVFLGPGAFSVDARLFGRREINIPDDPGPTSS